MGKSFTYLDILKTVSIVLLLALPPWFALRKYIRDRLNRWVLILIFIAYIGATIFTQNVIPFIVVIITLYMAKNIRSDEETLYYLRPLDNKRLEVVLYALVFKFIITILNIFYVFILMGFGIKVESQDIFKMFLQAGWVKIILLSVMTVIMAPVLEEFIFRHILYRGFAKKIGSILSAVLTSFLFALLHYNIAGAISFFGVGLYNCYLYEKYGYRASVINHFVFNLISVILIILFKALNLGYYMG